MPVNAINNVSFEKKTKSTQRNDKRQYFKWVSQNQTNDALKMSLGREVENGKYIVASSATKLAGLTGMLTSIISLSYLKTKAYEAISNPTTKEEAFKKLSSYVQKSKIAKIGMVASACALYTSFVINEVNRKKADKTANERGFLSEKDKMKMKDPQENFLINNLIYNEHIRG